MGRRQCGPKDMMHHIDASPEVTPVSAPRIASARRDRVVVRTPRLVAGEPIELALLGLVLS
jgi:hypothetical protein